MNETPSPAGESVQQMSDLVRGIARALVDEPERVRVEYETVDTEVVLRLFVPEAELGKLIGKQGRTARSLRSIVSAAGHKLHIRCVLDIQSDR